MTVLKSQAIEPAFLQHRNSCIPGVYFYCRLQLPVAHINVPAYVLDVYS